MTELVSTTGEGTVVVFTTGPTGIELLCIGPLDTLELKLDENETALTVVDGQGTVSVTVVGVGAQLSQTATVVVQPCGMVVVTGGFDTGPKTAMAADLVSVTSQKGKLFAFNVLTGYDSVTGVCANETFWVELVLVEVVLLDNLLDLIPVKLVIVKEAEPPMGSTDCVEVLEDVEFHPPELEDGAAIETIIVDVEVLDVVPIGDRYLPVDSLVVVEVPFEILVGEFTWREPDTDAIADEDLVLEVELKTEAVPVDSLVLEVPVLLRLVVKVVNLVEPVLDAVIDVGFRELEPVPEKVSVFDVVVVFQVTLEGLVTMKFEAKSVFFEEVAVVVLFQIPIEAIISIDEEADVVVFSKLLLVVPFQTPVVEL
ncbi:MAG: hypothetical protein M1835_003615, partial [Candelina submexicana]